MGKRISRLGAVAALAFFVGCGSDDVTAPMGGDQVSTNEAAAISSFLVANAFAGWNFGDIGGGGGGGASIRSGAPITIDYTLDVTNACPLGGQVGVSGSISGSIDDQTLAGSLSLDVATSATNCAFLHEETQFTLNTNPDLLLAGGFSFDQGELVGEALFTYTGAIGWTSNDGRAGSCAYDVSVTASATGSFVESGTVCGESI
jgi:hypothetical protein